jgi:hypothetical protein
VFGIRGGSASEANRARPEGRAKNLSQYIVDNVKRKHTKRLIRIGRIGRNPGAIRAAIFDAPLERNPAKIKTPQSCSLSSSNPLYLAITDKARPRRFIIGRMRVTVVVMKGT